MLLFLSTIFAIAVGLAAWRSVAIFGNSLLGIKKMGAINWGERRMSDVPLSKPRKRIGELLSMAGKDHQISSDRILVWMVISMPVGVLCSFLVLGGGIHSPVYLFFGPTAVYIWLMHKANQRQSLIRLELPQFMDLLVLSLRAGNDFGSSVERIYCRLRGGILKEELERILAELKMGYDRVEVFKRFAGRTQIPELGELASTLKQAQNLGTGISDVVEAQGRRLRMKRMERALRAGIVTQQKLIIPLIVFFMPVTFAIIFAPLVIRFMQGGLEAFL